MLSSQSRPEILPPNAITVSHQIGTPICVSLKNRITFFHFVGSPVDLRDSMTK